MSDPGPAAFHCGDQGAATWGERAAAAAALIAELPAARREGATIADIGCGDGKLRAALRARGLGIRWHGYDLHPQTAEAAQFDVRCDRLPQPVTVAAMLGVVDYLPDLPRVLAALADRADALVASHVVRNDRLYPPERRRELGWVSHVDAEAFVQMLAAAGWRVLARRWTDEDRTQLVLCERSVAPSPRECTLAVLSPYLMPPELQGKKAVNLGDGFILRAIERCIGRFAAARTLTSRAAPSAGDLAMLESAGAVVLAGANQLHDAWTVWPGLAVDRLRASSLRFVPFGIGLHGDPGRNDGMSPATGAILREVHARIPLSSWRCSRTVAYLRRELPELADRFVMTGCPVLYDAPLLDGVAFSSAESRVAVTVTERGDFAGREEAVLAFAARRFRHARRFLVLHQNWSPPTRWELWRHRWWPRPDAQLDPWQRLRRIAVRAGFEVVCPRDADEAIAFYAGVDAHLGSRLHAHLLCLSRAKRSWLVPVDGRAVGIAEDLGFPLGDPQRLDAVMDCDFEAVRGRARRYHAEMRRFLASIPQ